MTEKEVFKPKITDLKEKISAKKKFERVGSEQVNFYPPNCDDARLQSYTFSLRAQQRAILTAGYYVPCFLFHSFHFCAESTFVSRFVHD